ncbi:MAG: prephenate dehydrogenase/arogenate dehydrogenase family protein [Chloroflexaceae bacterium]|nr:prephenate dehydrogenase/arogenate dehydrogenase family protein [Chloroflexaceae bacterium]
MRQITVIGMGLIGTSLAGALRAADERESPLGALHVTGYDVDPANTSTARGKLAIDREAATLAEAVQGAQLVVIATPVQAVREVLAALPPLLAEGTVVTDVASTKAEICAWAAELLPPTFPFVGGHPMAGKAQHGPQAADLSLFQGAIYCLTPAPQVPQYALELVEAVALTIGARPYFIDPHEHDAYVAAISHLPFLLSAGLVDITSRSPAWRELALLAATGYRDMTRLASGDVAMHRDIALTNRAALLRWIDEMMHWLAETRDHLDAADSAALTAMFERVRDHREAWLHHNERLRPGEEHLDVMQHVERRNLFTFRNPWRKKE